jgi:hypothetical protein
MTVRSEQCAKFHPIPSGSVIPAMAEMFVLC